jgi:cytochrome c553
MRFLSLLLILLPSLAWAGKPDGKNIALHGNDNGAMPCAACHGVTGAGNPSIGAPRLAGLPAGMIEGYLAGFARGDGGSPTMTAIAKALSPKETAAVATYFNALKNPKK